jgi:hypothetical protein
VAIPSVDDLDVRRALQSRRNWVILRNLSGIGANLRGKIAEIDSKNSAAP